MSKIITDQNFESIKAEGLPFIVDFSATWCGPCKKISPIIDELATAYEGRVNVCKCDVDNNDELTSRFGIRTVPSVLFFKNGEEVKELRHVGAAPKQTFIDRIEAILA